MRLKTSLAVGLVAMLGFAPSIVTQVDSQYLKSQNSSGRMIWPSADFGPYLAGSAMMLGMVKDQQPAGTARELPQVVQPKARSAALIRIRWLGQASFLVTTSSGTTILIDPVNFKGYRIPPGTTADILTVSHEHIDHNSIDAVSGSPALFRGTDELCSTVNTIDTTIGGVRVYTVRSFHDRAHQRTNAIFVFEFDSIRMAHLGDIGEVLTNDQSKAIGAVDILMVPLGGYYTIAAPQADSIVNQLNVKRFVLPMHYKTEAFSELPYTADPFLKGKVSVKKVDDTTLFFDPFESEVKREYVIMRY